METASKEQAGELTIGITRVAEQSREISVPKHPSPIGTQQVGSPQGIRKFMALQYRTTEKLSGPLLLAVAGIYVDCFQNSSWQEHWTLPEAVKVFEDAIEAGTDLMIAFDDAQADLPVGFTIGHSLLGVKTEDRRLLIERAKVHQDSYWIAEIGVYTPYRRMGIAQGLVENLVRVAAQRRHPICASRSLIGSDGDSLFSRMGFHSQGVFSFETGSVQSERAVFTRKISY